MFMNTKVVASQTQGMIFRVTVPDISNEQRLEVTKRAILLSRWMGLVEKYGGSK